MTDEPASTKPVYGTKSVFVDFDDCNPASMADAIDNVVGDAFEELAEGGCIPIGPVSVSPASWTETDYPEGSHRETATRHKGLAVVITYKSE